MEADRNRILFVDDEPVLLEALRDAMRAYRRRWEVEFAPSGEAALELLAAQPVEVVIADMQMPSMDGATLLTHVRELYPTTIRMVLSGHATPQVLAQAATVAHRFLGKPYDVAELALLIERSLVLRELTEQAEAYRVTAAVPALPTRPGMYTALTEVLSDPSWSPDQIGAVIERDTALTAKVLQLGNSAFFGVSRHVTRVRDAVVYIGVETIKSLTLTVEAFGKLAPTRAEGFSIDEFQQHALLVARIAGAILPPGRANQEAVTAGLLHDIGKLVLIADDRQRWADLHQQALRLQLPFHELEQRENGVTHAATGAYLLSLWGLPDGVVEAVAHHHDPGAVPGNVLDAVAAVHIADALANESQLGGSEHPPPGPLDDALLERLGIARQQDRWRQLAALWAAQQAGPTPRAEAA
jgi:putative nucleotidyltransferase with HDIG domain